MVSRWQSAVARRYSGWDNERFTQIGGKLYFLDSVHFAEVSEDDILSGKNGWTLLTGDSRARSRSFIRFSISGSLEPRAVPASFAIMQADMDPLTTALLPVSI
jgi:hypothetical protein